MDANGTLTAGQTALFSGAAGAATDQYGSQYALQATAGAIAMNWTNATSARWATNAAAFRETSRNSMLTGVGS
jgi:hypothetical protein